MDTVTEPPMSFIERQNLCLAGSTPGVATHAGEEDFARRLRATYLADESNLAEQLIQLKVELSALDREAFWSRLMTGITESCHAQFAFVSKRVLVDDQTTAIEMPKIGEVGSCLMASALYYNDGESTKAMHHDYQYRAWSCPCAHMKHDKVFLIADDLPDFIQDNPNQLPFECQAYLGVPLFVDGKCFAHFGMMWTKLGMAKRQGLSWAFIEMFMHSLEDLISRKLLAGQGFARPAARTPAAKAIVIPESAITATQSLKVYARSLSHELRTPMQGVVGMLDLMYATVQEQVEGKSNQTIRNIFQSLKENIEVVQDSSKRAIEAADNVVHAYDLNMQVPETPSADIGMQAPQGGSYFDLKPNMINGSQIIHTHKRKRSGGSPQSGSQNHKAREVWSSPYHDLERSRSPLQVKPDDNDVSPRQFGTPRSAATHAPDLIALPGLTTPLQLDQDTSISTPGIRQCSIREVLPKIINDSLRLGGRPDLVVTSPLLLGEEIEVRTRSSNGECSVKRIEWSIDPEVPYVIPIDEKDVAKLIGAVFLNALKFTDEGSIKVRVQLSDSKRSILISVVDTGTGIPEAFRPELFKAFSKEETAITRTTEGLGLGLMVAQGLVRRIGGDIKLKRTATKPPDQGSEFEIRIPLEPSADTPSRPNSPFRQMGADGPLRSIHPTSAPHSVLSHPSSPLTGPCSPLEPTSPNDRHKRPQMPELDSRSEDQAAENIPRSMPLLHRMISSTPRLGPNIDRELAKKYPLTFLVADDNKINRRLLVQMLNKLGYKDVHEAYDGKEAVRVVQKLVNEKSKKKRRTNSAPSAQPAVDVILMDLWMPEMDGYQATQEILKMFIMDMSVDNAAALGKKAAADGLSPSILAVSADVTDEAIGRAVSIGMQGYMTKPFKVADLQKLILECCAARYGPPVLTPA